MSCTRRIRGIVLAALALFAACAAAAGSDGVVEPGHPPIGPKPLPDAATIAPRPPTADELAGGSLFEFVVHHGTTHNSSAVGAITGGLLRWRGGRAESPCPRTLGMEPGYADFVTARVRAIGSYVGAPMDPDLHCKPNFTVMYSNDPQEAMAAVLKWAGRSLGVKHPNQTQKLLEQSAMHPIQGWYITTGGGGSVLNADSSLLAGGIDLRALWPLVIPTSMRDIDAGRGILDVILVIDRTQVAGLSIGSIADYAALAGLTLVQSPDHCDSLPSILDLLSPTCQARDNGGHHGRRPGFSEGALFPQHGSRADAVARGDPAKYAGSIQTRHERRDELTIALTTAAAGCRRSPYGRSRSRSRVFRSTASRV